MVISLQLPKEFRFLVTGATGFIGSHLVHHLDAQGYEVHALCRSHSRIPNWLGGNIRWHQVGDNTSSVIKIIKGCQPEIIFHLAARFAPPHREGDVSDLIKSQVLFGTQVLEGMVESGAKYFINTGTPWEEIEGYSLYAATKLAFGKMLDHYAAKYAWQVVTLRPHDVYGTMDFRGKLITQVFESIKFGTELNLSQGFQKINLVHIDDAVSGYLSAAQSLYLGNIKNRQIFDIRSPQEITVRELVEICQGIASIRCQANWGKLSHSPPQALKKGKGVPTLPNWKPEVSLNSGLTQLWAELGKLSCERENAISLPAFPSGVNVCP